MDGELKGILIVFGITVTILCIKFLPMMLRGHKKDKNGRLFGFTGDYEGGLDAYVSCFNAEIDGYEDYFTLVFNKKEDISFAYSFIKNVKVMSESQMNKYISASRVALAGVLALGMKKERKEYECYVVIELKDNQTIVLQSERLLCKNLMENMRKKLIEIDNDETVLN